ncbi:MAG: cobyric acid synthase, partial [Blastocatellia bacterium]
PELFKPGVEFLENRLDKPCYGVVRFLHDLDIEEEDGVALEELSRQSRTGSETKLDICALRPPHVSNFTDLAALARDRRVALSYASLPRQIDTVDVIVIPGSKSTISDLDWMKAMGWGNVIVDHVKAGKPVIGLCGGFQMLGTEVRDPNGVEGTSLEARGLGLLDVSTTIAATKVTKQATARMINPSLIGASNPGPHFEGYEIHMGETILGPNAIPFLALKRRGCDETILDGASGPDGRIIGTYLHGLFDSPSGKRALLFHFAKLVNKLDIFQFEPDEHTHPDPYDRLADHFRRHLDVQAIYKLMGVVD